MPALKRVYVDLPTDLVEAFKVKAAEQGKTMKGLIETLIINHLAATSKMKTKTKKR